MEVPVLARKLLPIICLISFLTVYSGSGFAQSASYPHNLQACLNGQATGNHSLLTAGNLHDVACLSLSTGQIHSIVNDWGGQSNNVKAYGAVTGGVTDDAPAIQSAVNALPSCSVGAHSWNHCGVVTIPAGVYAMSSGVSWSSPFVTIRGSGPAATTILFTGTSGCAFTVNSNPFNADDDSESGGVHGFTIDGSGASAGTCGLHWYDIIGFNVSGLQVNHFNKAGSSGYWEDTSASFDERGSFSGTGYDNTTTFKQTVQASSGSNNTLGYKASFNLMANTLPNQTAISCSGLGTTEADFSYSNVHIVVNGSSTGARDNEIGIMLSNCAYYSLSGVVHIEGVRHGIVTDSSVNDHFILVGSLTEGSAVTDSINANTRYSVITAGPNNAGFLGSDLPSAGQVILSSGSGSHTFAWPYHNLPFCTTQDYTVGSHAVSIRMTTSDGLYTGFTLGGTGSDVIFWNCLPGRN